MKWEPILSSQSAMKPLTTQSALLWSRKSGKYSKAIPTLKDRLSSALYLTLSFGGKEKIRIDEIWVVVTGHISKGAQEKIHEKYRLRKVVFVDGSQLETLIDKYIPTYWSDFRWVQT